MRRAATLFVLLLGFCPHSWPGDPPPDCAAPFARFAQACRSVAPLRARFRHVLIAVALNQTEVEEGTVTLVPGGKMRWEYTKPAGKLAVSDGKSSTLYLPESREAFVRPLGPSAPLLFRLLSGQVKIEDELACEKVAGAGGKSVMSLRLLKADADIQKVEVTADSASGQVLQVRYDDPLGNSVSLSLEEIRPAGDLPAWFFAFKIPEGVKVIRGE